MSDLDEEEVQATREMQQINKIIAPEEKSADEMFEKLGYKKTGTQIKIKIFCYTKATIKINFYRDKTISAIDFGGIYILNMQELKAINKKCKELGWIE